MLQPEPVVVPPPLPPSVTPPPVMSPSVYASATATVCYASATATVCYASATATVCLRLRHRHRLLRLRHRLLLLACVSCFTTGPARPLNMSILRRRSLQANTINTKVFKSSGVLVSIGADEAYGKLRLLKGENVAPGSGVTIGFVDTGIDTDHPAFAGKTVVEQFLLGAVDETAITLQTGLKFSHGTSVASIAAGSRLSNNSGAHHGVAWGADIAMFCHPCGRI